MEQQVDSRPVMVSIRCITYNHEPFIRDCLEGFVMQKTDFRFEVVVHDDASTDGTAAIIREYAEKYPEIIKPIIEPENLYSKNGAISPIMDAATAPESKYTAICEGDDYWINPDKLQKQVNFLESHSDYTYCWTNAYALIRGSIKVPYNRYKEDCTPPVEDIIMKGGSWVPTCSILMRREVYDSRPKDKKFRIGDYPMQIWAAYKGKNYYFAEPTCVYRVNTAGSWSVRAEKESLERKIASLQAGGYMASKMNEYTNYEYDYLFRQRSHLYCFWECLEKKEYKQARRHWKEIGKPYRQGLANKSYGSGFVLLARFIEWVNRKIKG